MKLVHFVSSLEQGGAQAVLYQLIDQLQEYDHYVIYIHDGPYKARFGKMGIPVDHVSFYNPFKLIALLQAIRPDCLHTSLWAANWLGRIAAWWLKIPCVSSLHNHKQLNGYVRNAIDRLAPSARRMVAVSREVHKSFGYANSSVIQNGVGNFVGMPKTKQDLGLHENHFVIGSVGRFHPDKQYDLLIHTFALLALEFDHARLVLMGAGDQENKLRRLVHSLKLDDKVIFIIGESALPYYVLFDCFVLTSISEGISLALLEAMRSGVVPIIANHDTVHPVIEHGKNGFLTRHDKHAIVQTIKRAMNYELRRPMQLVAQKTVDERFNQKQMIQSYDQIFRHTISQKNMQ